MTFKALQVMLYPLSSPIHLFNSTTSELSKLGFLYTWITRGTKQHGHSASPWSLDCAKWREMAMDTWGCGWGLSRPCSFSPRRVPSHNVGLCGHVSLPESIPPWPLLMKPGVGTQLLEPIQKLGWAINFSARNLDARLAWLPLDAGPVRSRECGGWRCLTSPEDCVIPFGACVMTSEQKHCLAVQKETRGKRQWEWGSSCLCSWWFPRFKWGPGEARVRSTLNYCSSVPWGTSRSLKQISLQHKL